MTSYGYTRYILKMCILYVGYVLNTLCVPHLLEWNWTKSTVSSVSCSLLWLCSSFTFLFKNLILSFRILACLFNKIAAFNANALSCYTVSFMLFAYTFRPPTHPIVTLVIIPVLPQRSRPFPLFIMFMFVRHVHNQIYCESILETTGWGNRPRSTKRVKVETTSNNIFSKFSVVYLSLLFLGKSLDCLFSLER